MRYLIIALIFLFIFRYGVTSNGKKVLYPATEGWEERVNPNNTYKKGRDAYWQPINGTNGAFHVYSAFLERRLPAKKPCLEVDPEDEDTLSDCQLSGKVIRIIGIGINDNTWGTKFFCRLWLNDKRQFILDANVVIMSENQNLTYTPIFILCYLSNLGLKAHEVVGSTVAVVVKAFSHKAPKNFLRVRDTETKHREQKKLTVCVQPFRDHLDLTKNDWFIEWVEFNRLLGVSRFQMYQQSKGLDWKTAHQVKHYQRSGLILVLPWNLPKQIKANEQILNFGQIAAIHDCLYRSMSSADWLMNIDVDELIIPQDPMTLIFLLDQLALGNEKPLGAFLFQNAFFYTFWEDDPKSPGPQITARKTLRDSVLSPHGIRSKYIVWTRSAVELGNHFAWQLLYGAENFVVENIALLHHYRSECVNETTGKILDRTAHKYWSALDKRMSKEKHLFQERENRSSPEQVFYGKWGLA